MKLTAKKGNKRTGSLRTSNSFISITFRSLVKMFINFPGLYLLRVLAEYSAVFVKISLIIRVRNV